MKKGTFTLIGKTILLVLSLVFLSLASQAQVPAANISGPLSAKANDVNITLTSEIALAGTSPTTRYTLLDNTSNASIVSQSRYTFSPQTKLGTQNVIINPGNKAGSFVVRLEVTTRGGTSSSSKSVTVEDSTGGDTDPNGAGQ